MWISGRNGGIRGELGPQAPLELLTQLCYLHARHHNEFAAQHFPGLVVIGQLAGYATILAFLIPAEASIRNRFRADELKTSQERVPFGHLELPAKNGDFD